MHGFEQLLPIHSSAAVRLPGAASVSFEPYSSLVILNGWPVNLLLEDLPFELSAFVSPCVVL